MNISPDELVTPDQTASELRVKRETLTAWRALGRGPSFVKVGRAVFYRRADLAEWLGAQRRQPTSSADDREPTVAA
jgi:Helix-turn-helix domain